MKTTVAVMMTLILTMVSVRTSVAAGPDPIDLKSCSTFAILAGSTVTTTGGGMINGDVGLYPAGEQQIPPAQVNGEIYNGGPIAAQAQLDLNDAYIAASPAQLPGGINVGDGELGGRVLAPGVYQSAPGSYDITLVDLTLDGGPDDVWVFQMASTLTVGTSRQIILAGGAQAKNVFWQVGSSATLEASSVFNGTIMAYASITMNASSTMVGRALAQIGAVTFNGSGGTLPAFNLTVINGTGSGEYPSAALVPITATIPLGQVFVAWTGDTQYLDDPMLAETNVTMPLNSVTVTATFMDAPTTTTSTTTSTTTTTTTTTLPGGQAWTTGDNTTGELALGDNTERVEFTAIPEDVDVTVISAGYGHTLGIAAGQPFSLWSSGANDYGQLGTDDLAERNAMTPIFTVSGAAGASAGGYHSLAVTGAGMVWASGNNLYGQLGLGDESDRSTFTLVSSPTGVIAVSAGGYHSLALTNDGHVWACGLNSDGQLGLGNDSDQMTFVEVPGITGVIAISAGEFYSLALTSDGNVWSTGLNSSGQLGLDNNTDRSSFTNVPGFSSVTAISAGDAHSLLLQSSGTVWATGANDRGQLGLGDSTDRNTFTQVTAPTGVSGISAGGLHSLLMRNGKVWGTGNNFSGQLGLGDYSDQDTFVETFAPISVVAIDAGYNFSGAIGEPPTETTTTTTTLPTTSTTTTTLPSTTTTSATTSTTSTSTTTTTLAVTTTTTTVPSTTTTSATTSTTASTTTTTLAVTTTTTTLPSTTTTSATTSTTSTTTSTTTASTSTTTTTLPITYTLTVINGTGSGEYAAETIVPIAAIVPAGQLFAMWAGDTLYVDDPMSASTFVTMPYSSVTVSAVFTDVPGDGDMFLEQMKCTINWAKHDKGVVADTLTISGQMNPRGGIADLSNATMTLVVNDVELLPGVPLGKHGFGESQASYNVHFDWLGGYYSVEVKGLDLRAAIGVPNETGKTLRNLNMRLSIEGADLDIPQVAGTFECPSSTKANKTSKLTFKNKSDRTLTGLYLCTLTEVRHQGDGTHNVNVEGVIETIGGGAVVPTGDITVQIGDATLVVPFAQLVNRGDVWSYKGDSPGIKKFSLDNRKHEFSLSAAHLENSGIPPTGPDEVKTYQLPIQLLTPTDGEEMGFSSTVEILRKHSDDWTWKR